MAALVEPQVRTHPVPAVPQPPVDLPPWGSTSASNPEPCAPVRVGSAGTNGGSRSGPSGSDALSPWWTRVRLYTRDLDGQPMLMVGSLRAALRIAGA
jgi:hypothetical protein